MTLMELARAVDLPYPTAFRIVQTLVHEGLIECEPARKHYRATQLVQSLSMGYRDHGNLLMRSRPHIVALTRKISWPIAIVTHVGQSMMVRDSTHSESSLSFHNYAPGFTLPMLECASGHAYLAHLSDDARKNMIDGLALLDKPSHMLEMFKSDRLMRRIREDGFGTCDRNPNTAVPGKTSSIAAPVFEGSLVVGTLTLVFFSSAMPMAEAVARYAPDLKAAAAAISAELTQDAMLMGEGSDGHPDEELAADVSALQRCTAPASVSRTVKTH
jgi:IclR family mhp operon transcriptional activator